MIKDLFNNYFDKIKDSFFYFGAAIVKLPIALYTSPLFAKNLSASEFAAIGYFNALSTFLMPIIALNFYNYYMTVYHNNTKEKNADILRTLVSFLLIIDVFIVGVAFLILNFYLDYTGSSFNAYPMGLIVFLTSMFNMAIGFWGIKLRFEKKSSNFFILQTTGVIFSTLLGLLLVVDLKMGAIGRVLPNMIYNILLFIVFFYLFIKKISINRLELQKALKFSLPLVLSGLLSLPIMYIDKIFLEQLHNDTEFGLFIIASTVAGYYGLVTSALFQAFQPDIYKNVSKGRKKNLIVLLLVLVGFYIIGGFIFSLLAPYAVEYLTAGLYVDSIKYINLIIITIILLPISYFLSQILIAMRFTKLYVFNSIIMATLSILFYSYFIDKFEYFGAIYAKIIILLLITGLYAIEIYFRKSSFILRFKVV